MFSRQPSTAGAELVPELKADDAYGTLAQVDAIERGVKGPFSRRVLERCGHSPHRDRPVETTAAVADFVASLPPTG